MLISPVGHLLIFPVEHLPTVIPVGVQTADNVCRIGFDVSAWLDKWPDMKLSVWHTLPGDIAAYEAESVLEGSILYWVVRAVDTARSGSGWVEVLGLTADRRCPSGKVATQINESSLTATKDPPDPFADWYARLMAAMKAVALPETDAEHQQLVTDDTGKTTWQPRLAYAYQGTVEVLAPTALSYLGEESGMHVHLLMTPLAAELEPGKTYTVKYNGTSYECPVVYVPAGEGEDNDGYALGNTAPLGLEGSNADAPFVFMRSASYEENGYYAMCAALDGAVSVTLSITGEEEKIHKLPHAYYDQPDMGAMWNQEGYVKGREYWSVELPGGEMVFDPARLDSYETYTVGDGMTLYKISDIPMTKDALDGAFGSAGIVAGPSADDIYGLVVNSTVIQDKTFLYASINPVKNGVEKLYGYLFAIYDEGVPPIIGDITFGGLTPGTYVIPETDPPPYVRVVASVVGKQLDRKYGTLPKGKTTSPYLKWSEGIGWHTITLEQLKNDLGLT